MPYVELHILEDGGFKVGTVKGDTILKYSIFELFTIEVIRFQNISFWAIYAQVNIYYLLDNLVITCVFLQC